MFYSPVLNFVFVFWFVIIVHFLGFNLFATYELIGKKKWLMHDGYRYHRNRETSGGTHWLCATYSRTRCRGRASTRFINGVEMMRLNAPHSHNPNEWKFTRDAIGSDRRCLIELYYIIIVPKLTFCRWLSFYIVKNVQKYMNFNSLILCNVNSTLACIWFATKTMQF